MIFTKKSDADLPQYFSDLLKIYSYLVLYDLGPYSERIEAQNAVSLQREVELRLNRRSDNQKHGEHRQKDRNGAGKGKSAGGNGAGSFVAGDIDAEWSGNRFRWRHFSRIGLCFLLRSKNSAELRGQAKSQKFETRRNGDREFLCLLNSNCDNEFTLRRYTSKSKCEVSRESKINEKSLSWRKRASE